MLKNGNSDKVSNESEITTEINLEDQILRTRNALKLAEDEQAKLEEAFRYKVEEVKEELMQRKIDTAKAETECYKKVAEECKKEKESDTGKPDTNEGTDTDKPVTNKGGNENGEITSQKITLDCSKKENCGLLASLYYSHDKIGHQGFNTSDLLKKLYPEIYSNPEIVKHMEDGSYGATNLKLAFTEDLDSVSWFSNTKCKKCVDNQTELACQDDTIKSFCYPNGYYTNSELNKSFFSRESCPDLVRESSETSAAKAKQIAPLILVDSSGKMINKEGNNTEIPYYSLKPYLNDNGKIKDCGNDQLCKVYISVMEKVAWDSDKEVILKSAFSHNTQETNSNYYDNEYSPVSVDTYLM